MANVDHPALVLKRREPIPREHDTISAEWRRSALADIARVTVPSIYRQAFERWRDVMARSDVVATWTASCSGRLLVGAAGASVLESGVALHHTYGVPYIPGSALKGLCAHYAAEILTTSSPEWSGPPSRPGDDTHTQGDAHKLVFGTTADMGLLSFLDAWLVPQAGPTLLGDVLTPHHPDYYGDRGAWPADWDNPIPVPFLSVQADFFFALEAPPDASARKLRDFVVETIAKPALRDWGVGAKTAAGYGRLDAI